MRRVTVLSLATLFLLIVHETAGAQTEDRCTKAREYEKAGYSDLWSRDVLAKCPPAPATISTAAPATAPPAVAVTVLPSPQKAPECSYFLLHALKTAVLKDGGLVIAGGANDEYVAALFPVDCAMRESMQQLADLLNEAERQSADWETAERRHRELIAALQQPAAPSVQRPPQAPTVRRNGIVSAALLGFALGLGPQSAAGRGIAGALSPVPQFHFPPSWDQLQRDRAVFELQEMGFQLQEINDALRQLSLPR